MRRGATLGVVLLALCAPTPGSEEAAEASIPGWVLRCDSKVTVPANLTMIWEHGRPLMVVDQERRPLPTRITPLDATYDRVEVRTGHATRLWIGEDGGRGCPYDVARAWKPDRRPQPIVAGSREAFSPGHILLRYERPSSSWTTRIDWAASRADLRAGRHRTVFHGVPWTRRSHQARIVVETGRRLVFVRVTPYLADGTTAPAWEGWVRTEASADGSLQVGTGRLPRR